ncbi:MAG: mercuric transport protein MerTP [Flavobacteriales bacterium]|nr:mercuric transport protein MerTP [Flavobacteriales bacterium]
MKTTYVSAGLLAAIASSLCCIAPLIAIVGGVAGAASVFSWIEPARPFLIGISIIALGLAFYQAYKTKPVDDCNCEVPEKKNVLNSKGFLWSITMLSILMFSFPYYSNNFYSQVAIVQTDSDSTKTVQCTIDIKGMTCAGCENHVQSALLPMNGVSEAKASYKEGNAIIEVDTSKISISELKMKLEKETGYKVLNHKIGK